MAQRKGRAKQSKAVAAQSRSGALKLAQQGIALDCKVLHWGGFPFRFERDCVEPTLKLADDTIQARNLLLIMQAYMPNRAIALIDGPVASGSGLGVSHGWPPGGSWGPTASTPATGGDARSVGAGASWAEALPARRHRTSAAARGRNV